MADRKFYHYTMWFLDGQNERLNPRRVLDDEVFSTGFAEVEHEGDRAYLTRFRMNRDGMYRGLLLRTRDESVFLRFKDNDEVERLDEELEGEGTTGNIDRDVVNFAVVRDSDELHLLIEQGFQTPGIGKLRTHFHDHTDAFDGEVEVRTNQKTDLISGERARRLAQSELQDIVVNFKSDPRGYDDTAMDVGSWAEAAVPEGYRFGYSATIDSGNSPTPDTTSDVLSESFGVNPDTVERTLTDLDFLQKFSKLYLEVETDDGEVIDENLTDQVIKEEVDLTRFEFFSENLGDELIDRILEQTE